MPVGAIGFNFWGCLMSTYFDQDYVFSSMRSHCLYNKASFIFIYTLDLDFIPIEREQYDLVIPSAMLDEPAIQAVLETIRSENFRERVLSLGGYDPAKSGNLWKQVGESAGGNA